MNTRIAIVDDQDLVRAGLRMLLEAQEDFEVVGEGETGAAALPLCRQTHPDVVLMDIRMPQCNGIEATRRLCDAKDISTNIIMLTTFERDEYLFDAIDAGASGFLLKDSPAALFIDGIRAVAAGEALLSPSITKTLIKTFATSRMTSAPRSEFSQLIDLLTERELLVLKKMAEGLSNKEIATELLLGETTIKSHASSVFSKLEVRDRAQAIVFAFRSGLTAP